MKQLQCKKTKSTEGAMESIIKLELRFMTMLPSYLDYDSSKYRVKYEVYYGD